MGFGVQGLGAAAPAGSLPVALHSSVDGEGMGAPGEISGGEDQLRIVHEEEKRAVTLLRTEPRLSETFSAALVFCPSLVCPARGIPLEWGGPFPLDKATGYCNLSSQNPHFMSGFLG